MSVMLRGPFPPLLPSDVQIKVSPEAIPVPDQLHDEAGQTTASTLLAPLRLTVAETPLTEFALMLESNTAPSDPSCDHGTESVGAGFEGDVTRVSESARATLLAQMTNVAAISVRRRWRTSERNPGRCLVDTILLLALIDSPHILREAKGQRGSNQSPGYFFRTTTQPPR